MENKRISYLDSLRGWAIIMIVLIHTRLYGPGIQPEWLKTVVDNGDKGVQLFFVISGLSLCLSSSIRGLGERMSNGEFWIRRLKRIWPLFAAATLVYSLLYISVGRVWYAGEQSLSWQAVLSTLTLTHGLSPSWINFVVPGGWAVGTEVLFYLAFPWLWKKIRSAKSASWWFVGSLIFSTILGRILARVPYPIPTLWSEYLYYYLPAQLPVFLLGIVAYYVTLEKRWPTILTFALPLLWLADSWKNTLVPPYLWWGILWMLVIVWLNKYGSALIDNPVMRYLGGLSYEIYLLHFLVYQVIVWVGISQVTGNVGVDAILRWAMAVGGSVALATLVARFLRSR